MKPLLSVVLLCVLSNFGLAQKVPDAQRYKMLNTYHKAIDILNEVNTLKSQLCGADKACIDKAGEFDKFRVQLQAEMSETAKQMGLDPSTKFDIRTATDEVVPITPEPKKPEAKKPEEKK